MLRVSALAAASALVLTATACGSSTDSAAEGDTISVVTSFYPMEFAAKQVGGEHVSVTNLAAAGTEPHDLELTPKQVLETSRADQVIYLKDFQASVDDAAKEAGESAFDVSDAANLDIEAGAHEHGEGEDHDHEGHEHGDDQDHEGHDHGSHDPHFWLDPTRYADVAEAIAKRLSAADPDHAADYTANAQQFTDKLATLDKDLKSGLSQCTKKDLVTGHAAFAYFADRYGFHQESISGLTPDSEPSPAEIADLITHVKDEDISTVYAETLVPKDLAETIARDAGAEVAVLDPLEGITDKSKGSDYFEVMRSNLTTVSKGQDCQ